MAHLKINWNKFAQFSSFVTSLFFLEKNPLLSLKFCKFWFKNTLEEMPFFLSSKNHIVWRFLKYDWKCNCSLSILGLLPKGTAKIALPQKGSCESRVRIRYRYFYLCLSPKGSFESRARTGPITFTYIIIRKELQMHIPRRSNCFSTSQNETVIFIVGNNLIYPQSLIRFFIKLEIKWRISNVTFILNPAFRMYCGHSSVRGGSLF